MMRRRTLSSGGNVLTPACPREFRASRHFRSRASFVAQRDLPAAGNLLPPITRWPIQWVAIAASLSIVRSPVMRYETRIVGGTVEVTSPRTGAVYSYELPPGTSPAAYSLRCAERARVSECLAAIRVVGWRRAWTRRFGTRGIASSSHAVRSPRGSADR